MEIKCQSIECDSMKGYIYIHGEFLPREANEIVSRLLKESDEIHARDTASDHYSLSSVGTM